MIKSEMAAVAVAMGLTFACSASFAGELIITPQATGGATGPAAPAVTNRDANVDNLNRAKNYSEPGKDTTLIILDPNDSTSDKNRETLLRNRQRAKAQAQGKDAPKTSTLLVMPMDAINSQSALDAAMDRAHAFSDGDNNRRTCTSASSSVGTIGGVVVVDRPSGDRGVNTIAVGGCH